MKSKTANMHGNRNCDFTFQELSRACKGLERFRGAPGSFLNAWKGLDQSKTLAASCLKHTVFVKFFRVLGGKKFRPLASGIIVYIY